jgi:RNA polymerase sigma-70 factor (ECF subfamily)
MLNQEEELNLALKARLGDSEAFATLYNLNIKKIYDFIYFKTLNKELAEDLTSQVFLKVLKNISKFKSDNFSAWLYTIARHTVIDYYRSNRETKNIEDCWDLANPISLLNDIEDNLNLEKIKVAMKSLSTADRELLIMRLWLDLPFKEIASSLGKKESAVKVSFGRAIIRLRQKITPTLFLLISLSLICKKLN